MIRKVLTIRWKNRGQNFVEMALILPVLIILLMGMIEVGFLLHTTYIVATATREGTRYGSRGLHISQQEIADIVKENMSTGIHVQLDGTDANTRIWVTQVDIDDNAMSAKPWIDPDNLPTVVTSPFQKSFGDLDAPSRVCTASPCASGTIDVTDIIQENIDFSADSARCNDAEHGCRNDIVIVEVYYDHDLIMATPFVDFFLEVPVRINQQGIMRIMVARNPFDT